MLLSIKESFCAKMHILCQKCENLQNIGTIKQVFTAINGILVVKLVGIDTEIKVVSLKMQKLQQKCLFSQDSCNSCNQKKLKLLVKK